MITLCKQLKVTDIKKNPKAANAEVQLIEFKKKESPTNITREIQFTSNKKYVDIKKDINRIIEGE